MPSASTALYGRAQSFNSRIPATPPAAVSDKSDLLAQSQRVHRVLSALRQPNGCESSPVPMAVPLGGPLTPPFGGASPEHRFIPPASRSQPGFASPVAFQAPGGAFCVPGAAMSPNAAPFGGWFGSNPSPPHPAAAAGPPLTWADPWQPSGQFSSPVYPNSGAQSPLSAASGSWGPSPCGGSPLPLQAARHAAQLDFGVGHFAAAAAGGSLRRIALPQLRIECSDGFAPSAAAAASRPAAPSPSSPGKLQQREARLLLPLAAGGGEEGPPSGGFLRSQTFSGLPPSEPGWQGQAGSRQQHHHSRGRQGPADGSHPSASSPSPFPSSSSAPIPASPVSSLRHSRGDASRSTRHISLSPPPLPHGAGGAAEAALVPPWVERSPRAVRGGLSPLPGVSGAFSRSFNGRQAMGAAGGEGTSTRGREGAGGREGTSTRGREGAGGREGGRAEAGGSVAASREPFRREGATGSLAGRQSGNGPRGSIPEGPTEGGCVVLKRHGKKIVPSPRPVLTQQAMSLPAAAQAQDAAAWGTPGWGSSRQREVAVQAAGRQGGSQELCRPEAPQAPVSPVPTGHLSPSPTAPAGGFGGVRSPTAGTPPRHQQQRPRAQQQEQHPHQSPAQQHRAQIQPHLLQQIQQQHQQALHVLRSRSNAGAALSPIPSLRQEGHLKQQHSVAHSREEQVASGARWAEGAEEQALAVPQGRRGAVQGAATRRRALTAAGEARGQHSHEAKCGARQQERSRTSAARHTPCGVGRGDDGDDGGDNSMAKSSSTSTCAARSGCQASIAKSSSIGSNASGRGGYSSIAKSGSTGTTISSSGGRGSNGVWSRRSSLNIVMESPPSSMKRAIHTPSENNSVIFHSDADEGEAGGQWNVEHPRGSGRRQVPPPLLRTLFDHGDSSEADLSNAWSSSFKAIRSPRPAGAGGGGGRKQVELLEGRPDGGQRGDDGRDGEWVGRAVQWGEARGQTGRKEFGLLQGGGEEGSVPAAHMRGI